MGHKSVDRRSFYPDSVVCALCGLPIPGWIVWHDHPLSGTVDHILPISRKGQNTAANRQPAHRVCNQTKGRDIEDESVKADCLRVAVRAFAQVKLPESKRYKRARELVRAFNRKPY